MTTLEECKLFRSLPAAEFEALRRMAVEKSVPRGSEIFRQGDAGDGVYVVKGGRVEISTNVTQNTRSVLSVLGPGEIFGEMGVLETKPRSASAIAAQDSVIYFLPRAPLLALVENSPVLALELLRHTSSRLRDFNQRHVNEILQAERLAVIGRFARAIVHDLKNPLSAIGLTAELAAREKASVPERQTYAAAIRKQIERISEMIGDILDFTQGERAETVFLPGDYDFYARQIVAELRPEVELRGSALQFDFSGQPIKIPFDARRLRRVYFNLISNATDAMPRGGKITVRIRETAEEIITEVEDTGPGIAPEIAGKLFQAFATFGKEHGTGLGLSICKKIIDDHRGRIWAQNCAEGGARFSFALPPAK